MKENPYQSVYRNFGTGAQARGNPMNVFCSTIIPTIGRPSLNDAVLSVLNQRFDAAPIEVIVVNDSGQPLPQADWHACERVHIVSTKRHERCIARNTGAAIACGQYLHFLDDDDILLPGALEAFWKLHQGNSAPWLYGSYQTVDNKGNLVELIEPNITGDLFALLVAGEAIPIGASLLQTAHFFTVGAFDPLPNIVGTEDRDLGRRMAYSGSIAYTPTVVTQIRIGEVSSTTNWSALPECDRLGREKALQLKDSYKRLRISATSDYWRGRVSRAYAASAVWNLKHRNYFISASRMFAAIQIAGLNILSAKFWHGLRTKIGTK